MYQKLGRTKGPAAASSPMRVLLLAGEYPPAVGGVGSFAANAARALRRAGAQVRAVTSVPSDAEEHPDDVIRSLTALNHKVVKIGALLGGSLRTAVRWKPDVVVAAAWPHEGLTAFALSKFSRTPYAVMVHGSEVMQARTSSARRRVMKTILGSAALLIANSTFTKQLLQEAGFLKRVVVVNPPLDLDEIASRGDADELDTRYELAGKRVLLTAARLFPRKGHGLIIRTLANLRTRYPDLVYVATGDGPYRKTLEELAASCGVADRVRFVGFVSSTELGILYERCEVYVSPGVNDDGDIEGFGMSFIEASVRGRPVIAGKVGGASDAVVHGETGFLVDGADDHEFEEMLARLLDDSALRTYLGENGRARTRSTMGLERQGNALLKGLQEALHAAT
jgi:phosphatidylinositol alpha-1,6-mannosyltransferase